MKLPQQMPEAWLIEIEKRLKGREKGWREILLTPVIAAVIGAACAIAVDTIKRRGDEGFEIRKKQVDFQEQRLVEKRKPYDNLHAAIRELRTRLSTVGDLALTTNGSDDKSEVLKQSFDEIEQLVSLVFKANKDDRIDITINRKVNTICDALDGGIEEVRNNPTQYHKFGETAKTITEKELIEISDLIDKAIDNLIINFASPAPRS